jgi:hypothetical protein
VESTRSQSARVASYSGIALSNCLSLDDLLTQHGLANHAPHSA